MVAPHRLQEVLDRERPLYSEGKSMDSVLMDLRADEFSVIDCIKAVRELQPCSLAEAKQIVHFSEAWSDLRDAHDALHLELEQQAKKELD